MTTADIVTAQPASFLEQAKREARERQQASAKQRAQDLAQKREEGEKRNLAMWDAIQGLLDQSVGRAGTDEIIGAVYEEPTYASDSETRWVTKLPGMSACYRNNSVWVDSKPMRKIDAVWLSLPNGLNGDGELRLPAPRADVLALVGKAIELEEARRSVAVSRTIANLESVSHSWAEHFGAPREAKNYLSHFVEHWGPDPGVDAAYTSCMATLRGYAVDRAIRSLGVLVNDDELTRDDAIEQANCILATFQEEWQQDDRVLSAHSASVSAIAEAAIKEHAEQLNREVRQARMWWNFKAWRVTYGVKGKKGERWRTGHAWVISPIAEQDENGRGWYRTWDLQARKWIRVYYAMVLSIEEHSFDMAAARGERLFVELEDGLILPPPGTEEQPA